MATEYRDGTLNQLSVAPSFGQALRQILQHHSIITPGTTFDQRSHIGRRVGLNLCRGEVPMCARSAGVRYAAAASTSASDIASASGDEALANADAKRSGETPVPRWASKLDFEQVLELPVKQPAAVLKKEAKPMFLGMVSPLGRYLPQTRPNLEIQRKPRLAKLEPMLTNCGHDWLISAVVRRAACQICSTVRKTPRGVIFEHDLGAFGTLSRGRRGGWQCLNNA